VESPSPAADCLRTHPQPLSDLRVAMTLRGKQHQLRSQHLPVRPRVAGSAMHELLVLCLLQHDLLSARTWHTERIRDPRYDSF
jgi:hypothetical protein